MAKKAAPKKAAHHWTQEQLTWLTDSYLLDNGLFGQDFYKAFRRKFRKASVGLTDQAIRARRAVCFANRRGLQPASTTTSI